MRDTPIQPRGSVRERGQASAECRLGNNVGGADLNEAGQGAVDHGRRASVDPPAAKLRRVAFELVDTAYAAAPRLCPVDGSVDGRRDVGMGTRYSDDYSIREAAVRTAGLGIWREGSEPTPPWKYRANGWEPPAAASPRAGCPIKGNISRSGERIYHTPWSKWYAPTQIDETKGERWFCDEAEAAAAGWRPARSQ